MLHFMKEYYRRFWEQYRLPDNCRVLEWDGQNSRERADTFVTGEKVALIIVEDGEETEVGRRRPEIPASLFEEVVWLSHRHIKHCSEGLCETLMELRSPMGERINEVIQNLESDIIVFVHSGMELSPQWWRDILLPLETDQDILCSFGEVVPSDVLSLSFCCHPSYLPFWGLAFTKRAWALAGGFPPSLPLYTAWMIFVLRLKSLDGQCAHLPNLIAKMRWRGLSVWPVLTIGYQEGKIGMLARLTKLQAFLSMSSAVFLIMEAPLVLLTHSTLFGGVLLAVILAEIFLLGSKIIGSCRVSMKPSVLNRFFMGLFEEVYFLGYSLGVFNRKGTRQIMEDWYKFKLSEIVESKGHVSKGIIVYLTTQDWNGMFQRPQQLARCLAAHGYLVFYHTRNEQNDAFVGFKEVEENLFVSSVPLEVFSALERPIVVVGTSWYASILKWYNSPTVIYDYYDNLEVSAGKIENHRYLLEKADIVLASSKRLLTEVIGSGRSDALLLPNAVDYEFIQRFCLKGERPVPRDLREIVESERPIIGYIGALARWVDYELLNSVVEAHPEWSLVLVGVNYDDSLLKSNLLKHSNVVWLGWKPYDELFKYVQWFDVGIIPFVINKITKDASPIKLYEYFACKKPVVSTPLPECLRYPEVLIASNSDEFSEKIETALQIRSDPWYLSSIESIAKRNTWEIRALYLEKAVQKVQRA